MLHRRYYLYPVMRVLFIFFLAVLATSCEKEVDIEPNSSPEVLVVDGSIENGSPAVVYLTRSFSYFSNLSAAAVGNSFVKDATVSLSDGTRTSVLRPYEISSGATTLVVYTADTSNPAAIMLGRFGAGYSLSISWQGKTYQSTTTIPNAARRIDSLWWLPSPGNADTSLVMLMARANDPKGLGNYIRYFTSRNDSAFLPGLNSVFDDNIVDGTTYQVQIFRGEDRNGEINNDTFGYFRRGDSVVVKIANIDKAAYDFWRTWEQAQSNVGNPFGTPVRVLGNISNGALGVFCGYGNQVSRLFIPK
jgi:hypothetical protein